MAIPRGTHTLAMLLQTSADAERNDGGDAQNLHCDIIHGLGTKLQKRLWRWILEFIRPERVLALLARFVRELLAAQPELDVRFELRGDARDTASGLDDIFVPIGDALLQRLSGEVE